MIKIDKNDVTVGGTGLDILAEYSMLTACLIDSGTPEVLLKYAYEMGIEKGKNLEGKKEMTAISVDGNRLMELLKRLKEDKGE